MSVPENYAVVFSGGGALGAWEVGCLRAVLGRHEGALPTIVTGASAGAFNAAGLGVGMTVDEIEALWNGLTPSSVLLPDLNVFGLAAEVAGRRGWDRFRSFFSDRPRANWMAVLKRSLAGAHGVYDTTPLRETLYGILAGRQGKLLDPTNPVSLVVSTTLIADGGTELFFRMGGAVPLPAEAQTGRHANAWTRIDGIERLVQALIGTSALPILFRPMEGRFDGGVLLNQPISPAIKLGARLIYVFIPSPAAFHATDTLLDVAQSLMSNWLAISLEAQIRTIGALNLATRSLIDALRKRDPPDEARIDALDSDYIRLCVVRPETFLERDPGVDLVAFGKDVPRLIKLGEDHAKARLQGFDPIVPHQWDGHMDDRGQIL